MVQQYQQAVGRGPPLQGLSALHYKIAQRDASIYAATWAWSHGGAAHNR